MTAAVIFRKLAKKKRQVDFFSMSEYVITGSSGPWEGAQSTSYIVVGSQRGNKLVGHPITGQ